MDQIKKARRGAALLRSEVAPGVLLFAAAVLALLVANSPLAFAYKYFLDIPIGVSLGSLAIAKPLLLWINDGLMAIFFFLVGLELKCEVIEGELRDARQAMLPVAAAIGGMAGPAIVYLWMNAGDAVAMRGWAIPAATDIAFAVGVLALLGKRVSSGLKVFLLTLAIVDDLGAILIIAFFYATPPPLAMLALAGGIVGLLMLMNWLGIRRISPYLLVGAMLWVAVLKSGVHATIAGVLLALTIPLRGEGAISPAHRLEADLKVPVAFVVLPLFAFANSGVYLWDMAARDLLHPVSTGIVLGLFLGKQAGVMLMAVLLVAMGWGKLPQGATWKSFYGVAVITGIGFTMSLFVGGLAFREEDGAGAAVDERVGILVGSMLSAMVGYLVLVFATRKTASAPYLN